jgi:hypothetical protein
MQDGKREAFTTPLELLHVQSHLLDFARHARAAVRRPSRIRPTASLAASIAARAFGLVILDLTDDGLRRWRVDSAYY